MTADRLRILVAEDHPVFRDGLRALLATVEDAEIVAEAASGEEAVGQASALQPDVVLMDLRMPGIDGLEATRRIVATSPHIAVLVLTMFEDDESVFAALRAGARGYLLKGADQGEILRAIRAVASGEAIFGPIVAKRLIAFFSTPRPLAPPAFPELTEREREILELIARGHANPAIAQRLVLSPKTVRNHVSNIFSKLQVADRGGGHRPGPGGWARAGQRRSGLKAGCALISRDTSPDRDGTPDPRRRVSEARIVDERSDARPAGISSSGEVPPPCDPPS